MIVKMTIEEVRAVIGAVKDLQAFAAKVRDARDKRFSGTWGNEGNCTGPTPSHYVELVLLSKATEVTGIVRSRNLELAATLPNASFIGRRSGYSVVGEVVDVSRGRLVRYGQITLRLDKKFLKLRTTKRLADFLPIQATLWRQSDEAA
jgi:hypothetical protein